MGIFDSIKSKAGDLKDKAEDMASELGDKAGKAKDQAKDQASSGVQRAGEMTDNQTGGRFSDQIDNGVQAAQETMGAEQPSQGDSWQQS
jgi:ElaB/YqjD/DUF883 family membrane-anchored ribosome-binding protein